MCKRLVTTLTAVLVAGLAAAGCGSSSSNSSPGAGSVINGGTLRAGIPDNPDHLDTGLSYAVEGWQILEATSNGLVTFANGPGKVVPDMAVSMPTVTDGGRTYTFHLRRGIRFSPPVNRAVRPSDFQYAIERLFQEV